MRHADAYTSTIEKERTITTTETFTYIRKEFVVSIFLAALNLVLFSTLILVALCKGWWNLDKKLKKELNYYPEDHAFFMLNS